MISWLVSCDTIDSIGRSVHEGGRVVAKTAQEAAAKFVQQRRIRTGTAIKVFKWNQFVPEDMKEHWFDSTNLAA